MLTSRYLFLTIAASLAVAGCTTPATASNKPVSHYKLMGNRSADPLGNYADDSTTGLPSNNGSGVNRIGGAGAASSMGTSGNVR